ncbi:MFS transporter [Euzebya tangerina]|uniref:MFS transporter n=1 Tax=Euzebya tangerina TaxID=591198 RepID=UPI000E3120E5|nr:MFS transporter [Euzebya tangerina]
MTTASDPTQTGLAGDGDGHPSETSGITGMWPLFVGLGLLMIGNGLNGAVIGVRSASEGFGLTITGVIMAGFFAGFLLAPTVVFRLLRTVGHVRVFAGLASTASSAVLVHAIAVFPASWTAMRFIFGFCVAGLYIVIESWLAEMTTAANRGRVMAIYMIVWLAGLGAGQYLIALGDPTTFRLFIVSSVLVSMSLVPITLKSSTAPPSESAEKVSVLELIRIVPTGVIGSFMGGATAGILLGLGAVYATAVGLSLDRTGTFLVAPMIGAMILQWPIGRLSDRVSRRLVIFFVALIGLATSGSLALIPSQSVLVLVLMAALGGTLFPLYSLIVSYTIDWVPPGKVSGAAAKLIGINGSGAFLGPLAAAPLMSVYGPSWFFWCMAVAFGVVVAYLAWRLVVKEAMPRELQKQFVPFPARAGALAMSMTVESVRQATKIAAGRGIRIRRHMAKDTSPASDGGDIGSEVRPPRR